MIIMLQNYDNNEKDMLLIFLTMMITKMINDDNDN